MDLDAFRDLNMRQGLDEGEVAGDPVTQFGRWYDDLARIGYPDRDAVVVAVADAEATPSARLVLLRDFDERGFVFHTNYRSPKVVAVEVNPRAELLFGWVSIRRQVRVGGAVSRLDPAESDAYWVTRPRGSQIGAWASDQSEVIGGRTHLESRVTEMTRHFAGGAVPRPPWWGGLRVAPDVVEFWQGRPDRLHDRLRYRLVDGSWALERLAP